MISCLRVHMPPTLSEIPPSNSGALLLVWTVVVGSRGGDVSFWAGEDVEILFLSIFIAVKRSVSFSLVSLSFSLVSFLFSVSSVSFSSVFLWFLSDSCLLDSMVASMTRNC